jgi:hypothetical protein
MHGDILPAIPIVTPIYAVTAAKCQHLDAITMLCQYLPAITMLCQHLHAITMLCQHLPAITAYFVSTKWVVLGVQ